MAYRKPKARDDEKPFSPDIETLNKREHENKTLLAANTAQELKYESISKDVGVSAPTVKQWVAILERSGIIFILKPFGSRQELFRPWQVWLSNNARSCTLHGRRTLFPEAQHLALPNNAYLI